MKLSLWVLLGACVFSSAAAQAQTVSRIEISNAGIYRHGQLKSEAAPGTPTGTFGVVQNPVLVERTTRIPAQVGANFGFNFEVIGEPTNAPITLRYVTRFPAGGMRNPKTGKVHDAAEADRPAIIGGTIRYRGFNFGEDWEAVPGTWVFEFWYEGKMIASQSFEVVKQ